MYGISRKRRNWYVLEHPSDPLKKDEVIPHLEKLIEDEVKTNKDWKNITISLPVELFRIIEKLDEKYPMIYDLVQRMKIFITWYNSDRGDHESCFYEKGMDYPPVND